MKKKYHCPPRHVLVELYVKQRLSTRACALALGGGVDGRTVAGWLRKNGIQTRSISDAKRGQKPAKNTVEASVRARRKHVLPGRPVVGYKLRADGYVDVWIPETQRYVREHRLKLEARIGRKLRRDELVHHENRDRADNIEENLRVSTWPEHAREHYTERSIDPVTGRFLPGAGEGVALRGRIG